MKPLCVFGSVYVSPVDLGLAYYSYFVFNKNFPYSLRLFAHELWKTENLKKKQEQEGAEIAELQAIFTYPFPFILKMYLSQEYPSSLR